MFLNDDFLLTTDTAKKLFHNYAEKMPIIDYHCHLNPVEIYENKNFANLTEAWLVSGTYGDHYKWRLERANGIPEHYITGDADPYEKFMAWAKTIERSVGNPLMSGHILNYVVSLGLQHYLIRKQLQRFGVNVMKC